MWCVGLFVGYLGWSEEDVRSKVVVPLLREYVYPCAVVWVVGTILVRMLGVRDDGNLVRYYGWK